MTAGLGPWAGLALLGALGALLRVRLAAAVDRRSGAPFPFGTLAVNLTGSFALGALHGASAAEETLLLLGTGLLGAFTTFSTWMVESHRLIRGRRAALAWLNLLGSMAGGLLAAGLGWAVTAALV